MPLLATDAMPAPAPVLASMTGMSSAEVIVLGGGGILFALALVWMNYRYAETKQRFAHVECMKALQTGPADEALHDHGASEAPSAGRPIGLTLIAFCIGTIVPLAAIYFTSETISAAIDNTPWWMMIALWIGGVALSTTGVITAATVLAMAGHGNRSSSP